MTTVNNLPTADELLHRSTSELPDRPLEALASLPTVAITEACLGGPAAAWLAACGGRGRTAVQGSGAGSCQWPILRDLPPPRRRRAPSGRPRKRSRFRSAKRKQKRPEKLYFYRRQKKTENLKIFNSRQLSLHRGITIFTAVIHGVIVG